MLITISINDVEKIHKNIDALDRVIESGKLKHADKILLVSTRSIMIGIRGQYKSLIKEYPHKG